MRSTPQPGKVNEDFSSLPLPYTPQTRPSPKLDCARFKMCT